MRLNWLGVLLFLLSDIRLKSRSLYANSAYGQGCKPVKWNQGQVPGYCSIFHTACVDHGSRIVTHDERYQIDNMRRQNMPALPDVLWNMPLRSSVFPDALGGWQPNFAIHVRPASKAEPTPPLRHPQWSNCTLPVVLMVDYPYNYKTFVVKALTQVDQMFRVRGLAPGKDATLVLATPAGLALEPYHAVLLSPYSRLPLVTLSELGRRGMGDSPAEWSGEGTRAHCFAQLLACKLEQQDGAPPQLAAAAVLSHLERSVPEDPLGFGAEARWQPHVLRVVVEQRRGPTASWRSIRNVEEFLAACVEADTRGFSAGPFTRIACRALPTPRPDTAGPPPIGTLDPASPAAAAFRNALGAVRSAHLFVAVAGSSGAHAFFMDPGVGSGGGGGLVEVRPCRWGSEYAGRADGAADSMAAQLPRGDDAIRFFALNVEDPAQCAPPDYEPQLAEAVRAGGGGALKPGTGTAHALQQPHLAEPRYSPEELRVRDQHLHLRPATLLAMLRHAADLLDPGAKAAYQSARSAGRLHGYAVAEGLLLGPPGLGAAARADRLNTDALIRVG